MPSRSGAYPASKAPSLPWLPPREHTAPRQAIDSAAIHPPLPPPCQAAHTQGVASAPPADRWVR
eukprot:2219951-Pleurochrysis_carterae.AAC.1